MTQSRSEDIFSPKSKGEHALTVVRIAVGADLKGLMVLASEKPFDDATLPKLERFRRHAVSAVTKAGLLHDLELRNQQVQSGINCAEQIQSAMLPPKQLFAKSLADSFVLYRPKAVVSGDFYWYHETADAIVAAVVDCTGHGVPGAFMSMIGATILHQVVVDQGITDPAEILEHLDHGVHETLLRDGRNQAISGMDLSICRIDAENITFAGARQALYLYRAGQTDDPLLVIKGQRRSIGGHQNRRTKAFENHVLPRQDGDALYLMSDGFGDHPAPDGKRFGLRRLRRVLCEIGARPMREQLAQLEQELDDYGRHKAQRDDITLLGLRL